SAEASSNVGLKFFTVIVKDTVSGTKVTFPSPETLMVLRSAWQELNRARNITSATHFSILVRL
ncbi:MAG: hypothetical protein RBT73_06720, partial [Spirochaetia bacterium]|nr:hypothetical protein [Spirochaetia bacterium]